MSEFVGTLILATAALLGLLVVVGLLIGPERPREEQPGAGEASERAHRHRRRARRWARSISAAESAHIAELGGDGPEAPDGAAPRR